MVSSRDDTDLRRIEGMRTMKFARVIEDVNLFPPPVKRKPYKGWVKDVFVSLEEEQMVFQEITGDPNAQVRPLPEGY